MYAVFGVRICEVGREPGVEFACCRIRGLVNTALDLSALSTFWDLDTLLHCPLLVEDVGSLGR